MRIYGVVNNMKITNCCENLIRILLTLEYMCHKILINAHLKYLWKLKASSCLPVTFNTRACQPSLCHRAAISTKNGFKCSVIKKAFCSRTDKFRNCRQWWWFIAGKFHLKLIVTWSSVGDERKPSGKARNFNLKTMSFILLRSPLAQKWQKQIPLAQLGTSRLL